MNITGLLITIAVAFLITVLLSPIFIPFLRRLKFGQSIREEGPESHQKKSGTPTMGGVMIVFSIVITSLIMGMRMDTGIGYELWLLLFVLFGYGLLGFLDDYIKVVMKRNLGLTSKQKLFGQIIIALVFYFVLRGQEDFSSAIAIPGTTVEFDIGWFYAILIIVMLVGASNAVNLTDGLDGLLAGTAAIAFGAFAIIAWYGVPNDMVTVFALAVVGALLGFLVFNAHPAKVFMGDTGSLALGEQLLPLRYF